MPVSPEDFKQAFSLHPAGVALAMWYDGSHVQAITLTSVTSASSDPPIFVFSVAERSGRIGSLRSVEQVSVALPAADQADVVRLVARSGLRPLELPPAIEHQVGSLPILRGARVMLGARISELGAIGASRLFVAEVDSVQLGRSAKALVYCERQYARLAKLDA